MIKIENNDCKIKIARHKVSQDDINKYKNNSDVKFVMNNTFLMTYSYEDKVYPNERDLKSKYKGQTYLLFKIVVGYKCPKLNIKLADNETDINGYAIISKRDIRSQYPYLKRALTEEVHTKAEELVNNAINEYEMLINGECYDVEIEQNNVVKNVLIIANTADKMINEIALRLNFIDDNFDTEMRKEISKLF